MCVVADKRLFAQFPIQITINLINNIINHRVNITHMKQATGMRIIRST